MLTESVSRLCQFCELTYGVPPIETRIVVSALLPTRYPPLWVSIQSEKNRFLNDFAYVTRQLMAVDVWDTWHFRDERPRAHNRSVMIRLADRNTRPGFFAERYWRLPGPTIRQQSRYPLLAQECVRMRHEFDQTKFPDSTVREYFLDLVRDALAEAHRDRGGVVPIEPAGAWKETFCRRLEILPLTDKYLTDRTALARNLCFVAANHAALCGRTALLDCDLLPMAYVMRSTVPYWMERLLRAFLNYGAPSMRISQVIADTGFEDAWRNTGNRRAPLRLGEKLVLELWCSGLLNKNKKHARYSIRPELQTNLAGLLNGSL